MIIGQILHLLKTRSLSKLSNTFEFSTISIDPRNTPNFKSAFAMLFFFVLLLRHTNACMVLLFIILSELISALPYKLNRAGILSLIFFKFFVTGLFSLLSPLTHTGIMYAITAISSILLLSLRDEEERSIILTVYKLCLIFDVKIFSDRLLISIREGIAFLGTKGGKKIIYGFTGPVFSGSTLYFLIENERASVKAQFAEIESEATFLKNNANHTISLVEKGMLDKDIAQKSIFSIELKLRLLEIKYQNVLPPGQRFVNKVFKWVQEL